MPIECRLIQTRRGTERKVRFQRLGPPWHSTISSPFSKTVKILSQIWNSTLSFECHSQKINSNKQRIFVGIKSISQFSNIVRTIFNIEQTIKGYKSYLIYYRYRIDSKIEEKQKAIKKKQIVLFFLLIITFQKIATCNSHILQCHTLCKYIRHVTRVRALGT